MWRIAVLIGVAVAAIVSVLPMAPVVQDPAYHLFADQRSLGGWPHFWNVFSNLPFVLVGCYGSDRWRRAYWIQPAIGIHGW